MGACCCKPKSEKKTSQDEHGHAFADSSLSGEFPSVGSFLGGSSGPDGDYVDTPSSTKSIYEAFMQQQQKRAKSAETSKSNLVMPHDELTWIKNIVPPAPPEKFPYYVTAPVESMHMKLFMEVMQLLLDEGTFYTSKDGKKKPPFIFQTPENLRNLMDFTLPVVGVSHSKMLDVVRGVIKYQPHIGHPLFMEQRVAGLEPYAIASDMIATVSNSNNASYIVSTITTLLELEIIHAVCNIIGYSPNGVDSDGVITPGCTLANGYAMRLAVKQKLHHIKHTGLFGCKRPCFFVAESSVYSYHKCAIFQGFGLESVIAVREDDKGRMVMDDLRFKIYNAINAGHVPCMVVGTAGNNALRAIDPLDKIADLCKERQLWFHCDATFGGSFLCSAKLRPKLHGVERSDSFTWSQHFVLGIPPTCTILAVPPKHKGKLSQYLGLGEGAAYGFMKTPLYDPRYDIGHNTILCCRRAEIFKFWFMWKAKGTHALGKHVDHIYENSRYCLHVVKSRIGFEPVLEEFEGTNICFYYVPKPYRNLEKNTEEFRKKISLLTVGIRRILLKKGITSVSYCEFKQHPTFLVLGLHNSAVTKPDILYALNMIQYCGEALSNASHKNHKHFHELIIRLKHVPPHLL